MKKIQCHSYGNYSSSNYGVNSLVFEDGRNSFWFSYETLVAFRINGEFHIVKNYWGPTTGKHLNWINGNKDKRETMEEFNANYERLMRWKENEVVFTST